METIIMENQMEKKMENEMENEMETREYMVEPKPWAPEPTRPKRLADLIQTWTSAAGGGGEIPEVVPKGVQGYVGYRVWGLTRAED